MTELDRLATLDQRGRDWLASMLVAHGVLDSRAVWFPEKFDGGRALAGCRKVQAEIAELVLRARAEKSPGESMGQTPGPGPD